MVPLLGFDGFLMTRLWGLGKLRLWGFGKNTIDAKYCHHIILRIGCVCECFSCPVLSDSLRSRGLQPTRLPCPQDFIGRNTGVHYRSHFQGIFPTQGSKPDSLHCRWILYHLSPPGKPYIRLHYIACGISSSLTRNRTHRSSKPLPLDCQGSPQGTQYY